MFSHQFILFIIFTFRFTFISDDIYIFDKANKITLIRTYNHIIISNITVIYDFESIFSKDL